MTDAWPTVSHHTTLDPAALSAQAARGILRGVCTDARLAADTVDTALLLVSELVTNAVTHGSGRPFLNIDLNPERLHVAVTDVAGGTPHVAHEPVTSEHGRGLFFVDALASTWGVEPHLSQGKTVRFELDRPGPWGGDGQRSSGR